MKKDQFGTSTVKKAFQVIPKSDRTKVFAVLILQFFLGLLDLAGVAAIGVLGALAVTGVQSQQPGDRVSQVLEFLRLENLSFQSQAATLAAIATLILVSRTVFSIIVTRKIFFFLSRRGAVITSEMMSKLLSQNLISIQSRSIQENLYSITTGVSAITLGVLGSLISLIADGSLLIILLFGLIYVDPMIAFTTFTFFGTLGWILYRTMNVKAQTLGKENSKLTIEGNQKIIEVLDSFRESLVHNRRTFYSVEIGKLRLKLADVLAETQFLPNVSKYVLESGIIIGAVLISGVQFLMQDARHAVATLAVFLASGSRIAPAVMRIQQSAIQMRSGLGAAEPTLQMLDQFEDIYLPSDSDHENGFNYEGFNASINLTNVSLQYPNNLNLALKKVSIDVNEGESLAIVGPSGAGKTSLVDVLLGVLQPTSGEIRISGYSPIEAITRWPGVISYVPQDVKIIEGTIRENVALGYPIEIATDELVWSAIEKAHLTDFVKNSQLGLDSQVGEAGGNLSGGQRQRLGIARAFFTKPRLLVLDEATSSLDGSTEAEISESIQQIKGKVTVVMIAHRLSTVRNADEVLYLENGHSLAMGTFNEVRSQIPNFDIQAKLMGL